MGALKRFLESLLPRHTYVALVAPYHYVVNSLMALRCGFPARKLTVIGITGTKGKSSVSEMLYAILVAAGHKTALAGTIRFNDGASDIPNKFKMTMPGRGYLQRLLARAVENGATHAVLEVTSEGAVQNRHVFLDMNALIFTNLQKEHIESHGSMERYAAAKFRLGKALARSPKRPRAIVANADNSYSAPYLALPVEAKLPFSYADAEDVELSSSSVSFAYKGTRFIVHLPGEFTVMNALAAIKTAEWLGVPLPACAAALASLARIPGRAERVEAGQDFAAVVDYAHTPDSLEALYHAFDGTRRICVLGNTGGGRDAWKRPEMGRIADAYCAEVILTDEDPYDEDPRAIVDAMAAGMKREPTIIMDRRLAIREALSRAKQGDAVLITGKGTDPYIMRAHGAKEPWSDAAVVRAELDALRGG